MLSLLQRVSEARVTVNGAIVGEIAHGWLVLICAEPGDTPALADKLLAKILILRCFADEQGKMNKSVQDVAGGLLIVSQFTLAADTRGGNRPSFTNAAPAALGRELYDYFVSRARAEHPTVASGVFGADMKVALVNDGPVTIWLPMDEGAGKVSVSGTLLPN
jgi:D-aminoacyl-tRNA deacylase